MVTRLTETDVREIVRRYVAGEAYRPIAHDYGVSVGPIARIIHQKMSARTRLEALARGERHPCVKLTACEVTAIKLRLGRGETGHAIAKDFVVNGSTIYAIARGRTWR